MSRFTNLMTNALQSCLLALLLVTPPLALAVPVDTFFKDVPTCDFLAGPALADELGLSPPFPAEEVISAVSTETFNPVCISTDSSLTADAFVSMKNLTSQKFVAVWYVGEPDGTTFSNVDGTVNGANAFRIDSVGVNKPLLSESIAADGIFEPGEAWDFIIQDYANLNGIPASSFQSIGVPSGGAVSSGSIIGIVPEPSAALLLGFALAGLALFRRR